MVHTQMKRVAHVEGECSTCRWDEAQPLTEGPDKGACEEGKEEPRPCYKDTHCPLDTSPYQYFVSRD